MLQQCGNYNMQKPVSVDFYCCKIIPLVLELVFLSTVPVKSCFEYLLEMPE